MCDGSGLHYIHRALIPDMKPDTVYTYGVVVGDIASPAYTTRTPPSGNGWELRMLVFGDMVIIHDKSNPKGPAWGRKRPL